VVEHAKVEKRIVSSESSLADKVQRELAACIGCHDCLLACPLSEADTVGIADLNAATRAPTITSPSVVRFLLACTQCQQCVPACPADLSRADMVLFNKMKVEDAVPDRVLTLQVGDHVAPSPFTLDGLARELANVRLFAGVRYEEVRRLLLNVTLRRLAPGQVVCSEGEYHDRLVVVVSGALEQVTSPPGRRGGRVRILSLGPGSFFGEMAVMGDQPEPFAVVAAAPSLVVEAPKAAVHRLLQESPAFGETMRALYARRAVFTYASRPGALGALPPKALEDLLASATLEPVSAGQKVVEEGAPPAHVFVVRAGFLRVTRRLSGGGDEVLVYFREGDVLGAISLLLGERALPFTATAVGRAEVIRIPGDAFRRAVRGAGGARDLWSSGGFEAEQWARLQGTGRARTAAPAVAPASVALDLSWDVLVEQGLAEGRELLVVDQRRCTSCGACVDACGRRHGQSRLELSGIQVEHLLFPTACRHCDDPVCLLCSVAGIVRRPTGEIAIVDDNCIGCGACAERCPYDNIRMHPVEPERRGLFGRLVDFIRGQSAHGPKTADASTPRRAVKCDLCEGHDDYACVTACPVGAAFRANPDAIMGGDVFAALRGK
jgi:CRP-like cAMP-binding protein/Fe-S-cluster-containing hydrogenase component 2